MKRQQCAGKYEYMGKKSSYVEKILPFVYFWLVFLLQTSTSIIRATHDVRACGYKEYANKSKTSSLLLILHEKQIRSILLGTNVANEIIVLKLYYHLQTVQQCFDFY